MFSIRSCNIRSSGYESGCNWQCSDADYCAQVSGLEPHMSYALRVKALSPDGRFGNFSESVFISRVDEGTRSVC